MATEEILIEAPEGERLDRVVMRVLSVSRREARVLIGSGRVRVGKSVVRSPLRLVKTGRRVRIETEARHRDIERACSLVACERDWVVINKPSGLLSEPVDDSPSVLSEVSRLLVEGGENSGRLTLVHRLDAATSGVMVVARSQRGAETLSCLFRERQVQKEYAALTDGVPMEGRMDGPIARVRGRRWGVVEHGKSAQTDIQHVQTSSDGAWVRAFPRTGRTHQVRVHLAHAGAPLWGDGLYGGRRYTPRDPSMPVRRPMLHACILAFRGEDGRDRCFEVDVPSDFSAVAIELGLKDAGGS